LWFCLFCKDGGCFFFNSFCSACWHNLHYLLLER
jgi:hypothetical protein